MRILIIEDEDTLREQLGQRLHDEGYVVELAANGREGLYFGLEYEIDLAIIDLGLPEISGINVIIQFQIGNNNINLLISYNLQRVFAVINCNRFCTEFFKGFCDTIGMFTLVIDYQYYTFSLLQIIPLLCSFQK